MPKAYLTLSLQNSEFFSSVWKIDNEGFVIDVDVKEDEKHLGVWIDLHDLEKKEGQRLPLHKSMECDYIIKSVTIL